MMEVLIYYFTGTGNSLYVARGLSALFCDSLLSPISSATNAEMAAPAIGIVFPVYLWGMPKMVAQFIERMKGDTSGKYLFAVATYKSQTGDVIGQLRRKMMQYGMKLSAGFTVPMPGNNIIFYDVETTQVIENKLNACNQSLIEIAKAVAVKQETLPGVTFSEKFIKTGLLHPMLAGTLDKSDRNFWIEPSCNGCGVCAKVCPSNNVSILGGHPVWQHRCQQCLACIHSCPTEAIQYGKTTRGRQRYLHPEIKTSDLFRRD